MSAPPNVTPAAAPPPGRDWTRVLIAVHAAIAAAFLYNFIAGLLRPPGVAATDFSVFCTGWTLALRGQGGVLYQPEAQRAAQVAVLGGLRFEGGLMAFLNPPHFALLGTPLAWLAARAGEGAAFALWAGVNLCLVARVDQRLRQLLGTPSSGRARWLVTTTWLAFLPVFETVRIGQVSLWLALAALELHRALSEDRPRAAAAWLLVFSIKPQLMMSLLVVLAVRRRWRLLGTAALGGTALVGLSALVLGPDVWLDYLRQLPTLERFFGTGTPSFMPNLRGALSRLTTLTGAPAAGLINTITLASWAVSLAALAIHVARRGRTHPDAGDDLALALACALVFSPHLFIQDTVLGAVAVAVHVAALRARGAPERRFVIFALTWPMAFVLARAVDLGGGHGPRLPVDPLLVLMLALLITLGRRPRPPAWPAA